MVFRGDEKQWHSWSCLTSTHAHHNRPILLGRQLFHFSMKALLAINFEISKTLVVGNDRNACLFNKEIDHAAPLLLFSERD